MGYLDITGIEELAGNILIAGGNRVLDREWLDRLDIRGTDTGDAMSGDEVIAFRRGVDIPQLLAYRLAVGRRTQSFCKALAPEDLKRNVH